MLASMETYLRRGRHTCQRLLLRPEIRSGGMILAYGGSGFLLSAASLLSYAQPLAMGLICVMTGWRALVMGLGAVLGYWTFWGGQGAQGMVWAATGTLLALLLGKRQELKEQILIMPAIAAFLTAITGLSFQLLLRDRTPVTIYFLRILLTGGACLLFSRALEKREAVTDWLCGGVAALALAQVQILPFLNLGYLWAGVVSVSSALPAAVLAGVGLDLAQVTGTPMTAVMCLASFLRMIPFENKYLRYAAPGAAGLAVMALGNAWDLWALPGLILGGALGILAPPKLEAPPRRGQTGLAQVRLELGAEVMSTVQQILLQNRVPDVDEAAILQKARERACSGCSARNSCPEQLIAQHLENPLDANCRKQGRLIPELRRGQEQLRQLRADHRRRQEYQAALVQQYQFLGAYLRNLADELPRREQEAKVYFQAEVCARSFGKERANGDRCLAFPGSRCRYYVLLCDGMGTGLGAAQEGQSAGVLLRQMLTAGFPAEHALRSVNSILALRDSAGAVTVDLAELYLDTGYACLYKWGAAPSWVLRQTGAEKIGTATPPPGISVTESRETVEKLSLRRGEVLILLSDGVDGEEVLRRQGFTPDMPPGELAETITELGRGAGEDDATTVVIRLRPVSLGS